MSTATDWAWLAGFIDGEGCLSVHRRGGRNGDVMGLRFMVAQSDRRPLERVQQIIGGGSIIPLGPNPLSKRQRWMWYLSRRADIDAVLARIWPYLCQPTQEKFAAARGEAPIKRPRPGTLPISMGEVTR
jgi:hypothetical protein